MAIRKWAFLLLAIVALVASFAFAACGGGDDDDGSGDSGGTASEKTADAKDEGSSDDGADISTSTGSDEKFVGTLCKAGEQLSQDLTKVLGDITAETDADEIAKKFAEPFEDFSNAFAKASPPKDLKEWHSDAAKQLKAIVAQLKKGDAVETVSAADDPFPEMPAGAEARLQKLAAGNKDCQGAGFFDE